MIFISIHGTFSHTSGFLCKFSFSFVTKHSVEHTEVRKPSKASTTISTYFNVI